MSFNKKPLKERVNEMIGKEFVYIGNGYKIKSVKWDDARDKMILFTDLRNFTKDYEEAMAFLDEFTPVTGVSAVKNPEHELQVQMLAGYVKDDDFCSNMMTLLQNTIIKVQSEPAYIQQAKVIVNGVNSIMNIAKVKLMIRAQTKKAS